MYKDILPLMIVTLIAGLAAPSVSHAEKCAEMAQVSGRLRPSRAGFVPLLSQDLALLKTFKFAGPGPQPNMSREAVDQQFYFSDDYAQYSRIKKNILASPSRRQKIIQVLPGHETDVLAAVNEQFGMMLNELPAKKPALFKVENSRLTNLQTGDSLSVEELAQLTDPRAALYKLKLFVNEDLVFLKAPAGSNDFVIIGGLLAVPTNISMGVILGKSIIAIHDSVSDNPEKTAKFSAMINNSLAWLFTNPNFIVKRNNFLLENDPTLSTPGDIRRVDKKPYDADVNESNYEDLSFIRAERQTLRGLPQSHVAVFAILPQVYSFRTINADPEAAMAVAHGLERKLTGTDEDRIPLLIIKDVNGRKVAAGQAAP